MAKLGTFTYRQRQQGIEKLLARDGSGFVIGRGTERSSWFWYNGKKHFKASVGNVHGSGTIKRKAMQSLLDQLRVDVDWFDELASCKNRLADYIQLLRAMRVII